MAPRRKPTSTSSFGVGRRESHDASEFYARFAAPKLSKGEKPERPVRVDTIFEKSATEMADDEVAPNSVALVVTSPPYFAGKAYEEALGEGHIPASYLEYLEMLTEVFANCERVLEPGGRIAVNVANLGRRPYRSLSADVTRILQDTLGLLLRGEIIWQKAHGAGGSCAWGSFQSAANPVLRDLTERVIIASKGRFDRAMSRRDRERNGFPSRVSLYRDEFMEATTDLWDIPPEQASRVGHPAPFPVQLPQRLIDLYTYEGDLVLDPFMGSGSTAVAAVRTERHYLGYDTDSAYVASANARIRLEVAERDAARAAGVPLRPSLPAVRTDDADDDLGFQARAVRDGKKAQDLARAVLDAAGFTDITDKMPARDGVELNFTATDKRGRLWYFDVSGAFTSARAGLRRTDTLWKALGRASVLKSGSDGLVPIIFLTTDLPPRGSAGHQALRAARGHTFVDAIEMQSDEHFERLREYAAGLSHIEPIGELLPPQQGDG
jgi:site-specific DNA-methyltransferase (adenine-specific)